MKILRNVVIGSLILFSGYIVIPDVLVKIGARYAMSVEEEVNRIRRRKYEKLYGEQPSEKD